MWAKAKRGEITNFTGCDGPYDIPKNPEIVVNTENETVEESTNKILEKIKIYPKPACLFIGRWNGVFHNGRDYIIQKKLNEGHNVILAVRDVKPDEKNPWTAKQVKEMLEYRFKNDNRVKVIIIPDICSVEYGRGVGYEVNEIKVDREIAGISGTKCREMIAENNNEWKNFVPKEIAEYLEKIA